MYSQYKRALFGAIFMIISLALWSGAAADSGRITVSGTGFIVDGKQIYLNAANTPWISWNEFGGTNPAGPRFDSAAWDAEFGRLAAAGINATRVWISDNGTVQPNITASGIVTGANSQFWLDTDELMRLAAKHHIYVMATMMSFDHMDQYIWDYQTNAHSTTYQRWRAMMSSTGGTQSMVDNYIVPFAVRYKDNPYLFAIDLMNEPEWTMYLLNDTNDPRYGQLPTADLQRYAAMASAAIHRSGSKVLVTIGSAGVKYSSPKYVLPWTTGDFWNDTVLQSRVGGDPQAFLDFYQIHYYLWMEPWYPLLVSTADNQLVGKPVVMGEMPSKDSHFATGTTIPQVFDFLLNNGYSGHFPWTSNGTDANGNLSTFGSAALAFQRAHSGVVFSVIANTGSVSTGTTAVVQTITFPALADRAWTGSSINMTLSASATSGLPVTYSISAGPASVSGAVLQVTGTGMVTVVAHQAGNTSYLAATPVTQSFFVTATVAGAIVPNPLVSRGKTAVANVDSSHVAGVVDGVYSAGNSWSPGNVSVANPGILSIDIGFGPTALLVNLTSSYNTNYNETTYGGAADYALLVSADSTDGLNGTWSTVATVTGNAVRTRSHRIDFTGKRWLRLSVTAKTPQCLVEYLNFDEIDAFDLSSGGTDTWFFLGDSITAAAYRRAPNVQPSFSELIHTAVPTYFPSQINGGIGGYSAAGMLPLVPGFLSQNPDYKYWAIGFGTNDSWGGNDPVSFKTNMQGIIDAILAAGRIPMIQKIPYAVGSAHVSIPNYNAVIDELNTQYGLRPGPDLYSWFLAHPEELGPDGVHPNETGSLSINRLWAQAVTGLYQGKSSQTITFPSLATQAWMGANINLPLSATATSGLPVNYSVVSGHATINGALLTLIGTGTVTVAANQTGNVQFAAAATVQRSVTVVAEKSSQTITFPAIADQVWMGSVLNVTLAASATSGLPVAYSVLSGPATVFGTTLTVTGTGTVLVAADQAGNADFLVAPRATKSFSVAAGTGSIGSGGGGSGGGINSTGPSGQSSVGAGDNMNTAGTGVSASPKKQIWMRVMVAGKTWRIFSSANTNAQKLCRVLVMRAMTARLSSVDEMRVVRDVNNFVVSFDRWQISRKDSDKSTAIASLTSVLRLLGIK